MQDSDTVQLLNPDSILKPGAWHVWETIQSYLNARIKAIGVRNCAFPLFVSQDVLEKEKAHIEGFAAEVGISQWYIRCCPIH